MKLIPVWLERSHNQLQIVGEPLAVKHPILVVDHSDHGIVRVQIDAAS
ncbi:hypothetical protein [Paraburkholderia sp. UCT70]